jgi:hypothetical protein
MPYDPDRSSLAGPRALFGLGLAFLPALFGIEAVLERILAPPVLAIAAVVGVQALLLATLLATIGRTENGAHQVAFSLGLLVPVAVAGFLAELPLPLTLLGDGAMFLFFRHLWRRYRPKRVPLDSPRSTVVA